MRPVRHASIDSPKLTRIAVIVAIGCLLMGAATWLAGVDLDRDDRPRPKVMSKPVDPLRIELERCAGLGTTALEDPACRNAWTETRRRFFSPARPKLGDTTDASALHASEEPA